MCSKCAILIGVLLFLAITLPPEGRSRELVETSNADSNEIRPILPKFLDEFFKVMNEDENEDLVFTLEIIGDKFGEEMASYALGLCQNLTAAFWRCMNGTADADDPGDKIYMKTCRRLKLYNVNDLNPYRRLKLSNVNGLKAPKGPNPVTYIPGLLEF